MRPDSTKSANLLIHQEQESEKTSADKPYENARLPRMRSSVSSASDTLKNNWKIPPSSGQQALSQGVWLKPGNPDLEAGLQELQKKNPGLDQDAITILFIQQFVEQLINRFDQLEFQSADDKLAFAKLFAAAKPGSCAKNFKLFGLTDAKQKIEIARECKHSALKHRVHFSLSDADLFSLACEVAREQTGALIVGDIVSELNLPEENQRIKLAHICLNGYSTALAAFLPNFNISSEEERLKLGLKYFDGDSPDLTYLEDFGLTTCENKKKLAFSASSFIDNQRKFTFIADYLLDSEPAEKALTILIEFLIHFGIEDSEKILVANKFNSLQKTISNTLLSSANLFYLQSKPNFQSNKYRKNNDIFRHLFSHLQSGPVPLEIAFGKPLVQLLPSEPSEIMQLLEWVRDVCFLIQERQLNEPRFLEKLQPALLQIMSLRDKNYRTTLTESLFNLAPAQISNFNPAGLNSSNYLPALLMEPIATPHLRTYIRSAPASIFGDGRNQKKFIECVLDLQTALLPAKPIQHILLQVFPTAPETIRYPNRLLKPENLNKAGNSKNILEFDTLANSREKQTGKNKAVSQNEFDTTLRALSKIRTLVAMDEEIALNVAGNTPALIADEVAIDDAIKTIVTGSLKLSDADYLKFSNIFYAYREPVTILTYIGRIRFLPALHTLHKFISATLAGDFPAIRYQADPLLAKCTAALRAAWQTNIEAPFIINGKVKPKWKLAFTDDHQDLMRMGSDVRGSCQRVDGEPYLNRGLVGNVMDGKQKICVLKNEEGKIVGRAILRMMSTSNPETGIISPCMMMEKIYPDLLHADEEKAIFDLAIAQAKRLGLPMAISSDITPPATLLTEPASQTLYSGAIAYPVYCDALSGMQEADFHIQANGEKPLSWLYQPAS